MKKNIELLMAKQFAELAVCNLDAVMKDNSLSDKEYNSIREAHDSIASARDTIVRLTKPKRMVSAEAKESGYGEPEDERIRKAIHIYLDWLDGRNKDYQPKGDYSIKDMLAWLEKQGTSYTKRDVDDAYIEGMAFAKDELEKQKLTWSEEDEVRLQACIDILQAKSIMGKVDTIHTNWLKSLKNRIK